MSYGNDISIKEKNGSGKNPSHIRVDRAFFKCPVFIRPVWTF